MKRKNGFTLIELLAVIVILAIIALIATPIILNVINDARKSAAKDSAYGYIEAIETQNQLAILDSEKYQAVTSGNVEDLNVTVKGSKPSSGSVTIENGKVTSATLCINNYNVSYDGTNATVGNGCSSSSSGSGSSSSEPATPTYTAYSIGNSINYNPVANEPCTTPTSTTGTKIGCMKWYVIKESGTSDDKVDVILDHNTTALVAYETSGTYKEYAQASIKTQVDTDTTGWTSGLNPRLITAQEIADITNTTTYDGSSGTYFYFDGTGDKKQTQASSTQGASPYKWLYDYTNGCESYGCTTADLSTYGYWTSSAVSDDPYYAGRVGSDGGLFFYNVDGDDYFGVRPVITISKSDIQ